MTYSTSGNGSINHLLSESLKVEAGIDMVHVPYKAIAAALTDVMSGNVDNAFAAVPSAIQLIRGGKLRAVAVSSAKRNAGLPDVPSIAEMGYPELRRQPVVGHPRAGRHAEADRRQDQRRRRAGPEDSPKARPSSATRAPRRWS